MKPLAHRRRWGPARVLAFVLLPYTLILHKGGGRRFAKLREEEGQEVCAAVTFVAGTKRLKLFLVSCQHLSHNQMFCQSVTM